MDRFSLSERLKELRSDHNYSQAYIAQKLNISRQTYSHYETGRIIPPTDSLRALAELYHISMDILVPTDTTKNVSLEYDEAFSFNDHDFSKGYLHFVHSNRSRLASLNNCEKHLLYYYSILDARDQKDILSFMKLKCINRKNDKN